jgi:hypothetical protein
MRRTRADLARCQRRQVPGLRGGQAVGILEGTTERTWAFEAELLGDLAYRQRTVAHQRPGAGQAQAHDVLARRFAEDVAIHADQVPGRVAGAAGKLAQVEVGIAAAFDKCMHEQQALQGKQASLRRASTAAVEQRLQVALMLKQAGAQSLHRGVAINCSTPIARDACQAHQLPTQLARARPLARQ